MAINIDDLLNAELPVKIRYSGNKPLKPALRELTIVELFPLDIGFLSPEGSTGCKMAGGGSMWILDVAINYELAAIRG